MPALKPGKYKDRDGREYLIDPDGSVWTSRGVAYDRSLYRLPDAEAARIFGVPTIAARGGVGDSTPASTNGHDPAEAEPVVEEAVAEAAPAPPRGFLGGGPVAGKYKTKALVLAAIARGGGGWWAGKLVRATGLDRAKVNGVLRSSLRARDPFIERTRTRQPLLPDGSAYMYRLSGRGVGFLRWCVRAGLVDLGADFEGVLAGARTRLSSAYDASVLN